MPSNTIKYFLLIVFLFLFSPPQLAAQSPIIWSSDFETGNIASEWRQSAVQGGGGDIIFQNSSIQPSIVTDPIHRGTKAAGLTIDLGTYDPNSNTNNQAVYLFRWFITPPVSPYYYSAWYYIPSGIKPDYYHEGFYSWWNIFQFKSTTNNRANNNPVFTLDVLEQSSTNTNLMFVMTYRPNFENLKQEYRQTTPMTIPRDRWFHVEAYYVPSSSDTTNGQITVWQDGVQIFNVTNKPTVLADRTVFWSANHYAPALSQFIPRRSTIYVDDAIISTTRTGPGLPSPTTPPCSNVLDQDCDTIISTLDLVTIILKLGQNSIDITDFWEAARTYGRNF